MFDFPASPVAGQTYLPVGGPSFVYDGEKWNGGQLAGTQKETFIDYTGRTTVDVAVPTWAKSCTVTAAITTSVAGGLNCRVSVDGTTFLVGASDYQVAGPLHSTGNPTPYATQGSTVTDRIIMTASATNVSLAHVVTTEITLVRPTSDVFTYRSHGTCLDNGVPAFYTGWYQGYVTAGSSGSALAIKALRFYGLTGKAGSHIHIQWLGDDQAASMSNAIADAPNDGGEYVRANGVWRLKEQVFDIAGKTSQNILVPAWGPSSARMTVLIHGTVAVPALAGLRASHDGITYPVGPTNEYAVGGFYHRVGAPAVIATASWNWGDLTLTGATANTAEHGIRIDVLVQLKRANTAQQYSVMWRGDVYNSTVGWAYSNFLYGGAIMASAGGLSLKGLQLVSTTAWTSGNINVEWLA